MIHNFLQEHGICHLKREKLSTWWRCSNIPLTLDTCCDDQGSHRFNLQFKSTSLPNMYSSLVEGILKSFICIQNTKRNAKKKKKKKKQSWPTLPCSIRAVCPLPDYCHVPGFFGGALPLPAPANAACCFCFSFSACAFCLARIFSASLQYTEDMPLMMMWSASARKPDHFH